MDICTACELHNEKFGDANIPTQKREVWERWQVHIVRSHHDWDPRLGVQAVAALTVSLPSGTVLYVIPDAE